MNRAGVMAVLAGVLAVTGCAAKRLVTADEYFATAERHFRQGSYSSAVQAFRDLLDQHPFSAYSEEAELRTAHAYYLEGEFIQAIGALTDFQRRHPTSPHLAFVGYALGMCYARQMRSIDRDQSPARSAQSYFQTVIYQYPDSPYAELAREQLAECQRRLAGHELYVARFYERHGNEKAAERRALAVVGQYPETGAAAQALHTLAQLYRERDDQYRSALAYAALAEDHPADSGAAATQSARARREGRGVQIPDKGARQELLAAGGYVPRAASAGAEPIPVPGIDPSRAPMSGPATAARPPARVPHDPFGSNPGGMY